VSHDPPPTPWPFARTAIFREVVDSTNDLARQVLAGGGVGLPLLVLAGRQTAGRGRRSRSWWSDEGSLTFTLGIDPASHGLRPGHEPRLALATAVAVIDAIAPLLAPAEAGLRWPNDIEVAGRKLGGILPERVEAADGPRLIIGIGLNVTTRLDDAPTEVRRMATTLAESGRRPTAPGDRDDILRSILSEIAAVLDLLARDDPALARRWEQLDTLRGQRVRVDLGPRIVAGIGQGIDPEGGLRLKSEAEDLTLHGGQVLRS
jgi:BirA family transcriptional regulator, biotin operon repressor / biotin---[acetyl-CoA-carboxylase] ligase